MERRPYIVCAACMTPGGLLIPGARHWDSVMHALGEAMNLEIKDYRGEQGFMDQYGRFHLRKAAMRLARVDQHNNLRILREEPVLQLYSEDLY